MSRVPLSRQAGLRIILLILALAILLAVPLALPAGLGAVDFRPYWSSSYLLAHGRDFSDPSLLETVERTLTGWREPYTMQAWFAPTGNLVLLPYTLVSFPRAVYWWLLTNIGIVVASALLIWRDVELPVWIPLTATLTFAMTLTSLYFGQVNTVVVLGLALFLFLCSSRRDFAAGASLVLTTVKPHLVILTLPLLLLDILRSRQWRMLAGFASVLAGCVAVLFIFYPSWPISFWGVVNSGMRTARAAPTLSGLLVLAGVQTWSKWIWVVGLVFATAIWWNRKVELSRRTLIDVSILAGMLVSPIGWSYDQVMLLFPILRILEWAAGDSLYKKDAVVVLLLLIIINAIAFYPRLLGLYESRFVWVPMAVAAVYALAWQRTQSKLRNIAARAV